MNTLIHYKNLPKDYCIWSASENRIIILEPCPFCGHQACLNANSYGVYGWCPKCRAQGPIHSYDEKQAIKNWNNYLNIIKEK